MVKIGTDTLDPFGNIMAGLEYPYRLPQNVKQDTFPLLGLKMVTGIRLPPTPEKMQGSQACKTCLNHGCYSLCATAKPKAIGHMKCLAFANHDQRRAVNLGLNSHSPTPHQLRVITKEYENADDPTLGPPYISTNRAASIDRKIYLSSQNSEDSQPLNGGSEEQ